MFIADRNEVFESKATGVRIRSLYKRNRYDDTEVVDVDASGKAVRGTRRFMYVDSIRRRYNRVA